MNLIKALNLTLKYMAMQEDTIDIKDDGEEIKVTQTDITTEEYTEGPQIKKGAIIALAALVLLAGGAYVAMQSNNQDTDDTLSGGQILGENTGLVREDQTPDSPNPIPNDYSDQTSPSADSNAEVPSSNAVKPVPTPAPTTTAPAPAPSPSAPVVATTAPAQPTEKVVSVPLLKLSVTIPISWYADLRATSGNELFLQNSSRTSSYGSIEVFVDANETIEEVYGDLISDPANSNISQITINGQTAWQFNRSGYVGRLIALIHSNNVYILKGQAATTSFIPNIRFH